MFESILVTDKQSFLPELKIMMSLKCFPNKVDVKFARQRNCSLDDRKVQCFHARRCPEKEWVGDARMFIRMKQFPLESNRTSLLR